MIKVFCDGCEKEINRNYASDRFMPVLNLNGKKFMAEVIIHQNGTANMGHLCHFCLMKIITEGKEVR